MHTYDCTLPAIRWAAGSLRPDHLHVITAFCYMQVGAISCGSQQPRIALGRAAYLQEVSREFFNPLLGSLI